MLFGRSPVSRSLKWVLILGAAALTGVASAQVRTGKDAYGDYRSDAPGVVRKITPADMPAPGADPSGIAPPARGPRPAGAMPRTLPGFEIKAFAQLDKPRLLRIAPNGDIFVAESDPGKIVVLRARPGADAPEVTETFIEGLKQPFGIAFYPLGANPEWVYVGLEDGVVRIPYRSGDTKARGPAEVLIPKLTVNRRDHRTRDLLFTRDGKRFLLSVGSSSNTAEDMSKKTVAEAQAWEKTHALGSGWDKEEDRADVLSFDPTGKDKQIYATGIRNCVGMAFTPASDQLWCSVNERDTLGDNLVPDYITRVKPGGFYGWPWYYIGDHEDPKFTGQRPDLKGKVTTPDILLQAHSASLQMAFYPPNQRGPDAFSKAYAGQIFAAEHGSWNRSKRTGYKVIMARVVNGVPTGEYEDFVTGFVIDDASVWGRPVGVAVAQDGALLFSDDGSGILWRVTPKAGAK